jgi:DNA-binding beta-propeller fold protein YncE
VVLGDPRSASKAGRRETTKKQRRGEQLVQRHLHKVGEAVAMKSQMIKSGLLIGALSACAGLTGCGGGSSTANQVNVTVTGSTSVLVPKQTETLTANVTGATDVSSTFACTFTTTPAPTTATPNPTPSAAKPCDDATVKGAVGALSNITNTSTTAFSTATFTAPDVFPDQVAFPNVIVTITATSHANTKKTGAFSIQFDSGVRIVLIPNTATLATGEPKNFNAEDLNGTLLTSDQVTWGVTYESTAKINSVSCSGGSNDCGTLSVVNGIERFTAPAKVPVAAPASTTAPVNAAGIVTIFVFSKIDNARIAQGSITIVAGGPISFNGLAPITVPLGGPAADIFLSAPNVTSQVGIKLTGPTVNETIDSTNSNKIKIVFAAGGTTSIGARVRLNPSDLPVPGVYQIQVTSGGSATVTGGPFSFTVLRAAPSVISASPDNFQQQRLGQASTPDVPVPQVTIDGGYFGQPPAAIVSATFNNTTGLLASTITPRSITGNLPVPQGLALKSAAGLFPISVTNSTLLQALTARANIAVIPDYGATNASTANPPTVGGNALTSGPAAIYTVPPKSAIIVGSATSAPSSVAIGPTIGIGAITLAGANDPGGAATNTQKNVQFFSVAGGNVSLLGTATTGGNVATSVAVDDNVDADLTTPIAAVVNYASRSLSIINLPTGTAPVATVDLSGVIPPSNPPSTTFVQPFPYAVGIDPFLHRALVAFASTNIGLIVNLNANPTKAPTCILAAASAPYCVTGYVTLNTGAHPQVAFEPGAHIAYVTPGGGGLLEGINLATPPAAPVIITKAVRTANSVQITTKDPHNISSGVSGLGGPTVLIAGLPQGTNKTNFNGTFPVTSVLGTNDFTYAQAAADDTSTCTASDCTTTQGAVNLVFQVSQSIQGIAVNPITRRLAFVDPNVAGSQIEFLDPLSQSFTAMSLFKDGTGATFTGAPEIGETSVAFQPFSKTAVVFNPSGSFNQISLIDPSILERAAIVKTGQLGTGSVSFPPTIPAAMPLSIPGALAVDPVSNIAIAANSGDGTLTVIGLGTIKPVHIQELRTPDIAGTTLRRAFITTSGVTPNDLAVKIFGSGFDNTSQVRLDGTALSGGVTLVSNHELDVTIPKAFLAAPHRFAVDVITGNVFSNVVDFTVLESVPIPACGTVAAPIPAAPGGVAIDEQRNLAVVTNTACHQVSLLSVDPNNKFGQLVGSILTGDTPTGVAVLPRLSATLGVAVVTNNKSGTVSILDLDKQMQAAKDVTVGSNPTGVAINQQTNLAVIANTGSGNVSAIDLTPLTANPVGTLTVLGPVGVDISPIAVAIDPDRGTNSRGLAVVSALQSNGASSPFGVLDAIDIGGATPVRSTSAASASFLGATPTGLVFDPAATTSTANPGLFYSVSSQSNQVVEFNPDNGSTRAIPVGINPNSLAINVNTGSVLTVNAASNTISLIDAQTLQTKLTIGIGATGKLAAVIHNQLNLAVIVDQANNRILLLPLP